jgi:homopolymeric O-antigen transport system ATP-binding protein
MSNVAISVENLSKAYTISHEDRGRSRYKTLREDLIEAPKRLWSRLGRNGQSSSETFWALKDISFQIKQGEVIGIIGRNGAGKSTLLKILSRITEPTSGEVKIYGRVGSLLEVGTGFHQELTGRENIFLNGAILGMSRAEIRARFDEIVAFAEVEKFLDTPVKRYSSGMYVRLAFAVAAHLNPEILLVDEVLAVGDAEFQKKCLGKMKDVSRGGRTVLFVSHNIAAVQSICSRGIVLDHGRIYQDAEISESIASYLKSLESEDKVPAKGGLDVQLLFVRLVGDTVGDRLTANGSLKVEVQVYTKRLLTRCNLNLVIEDSEGRFIFHHRTDFDDLWPSFEPGRHRIITEIPRLSLASGAFSVWFRLYNDTGESTVVADSDKVVIHVHGRSVGGILNIPCHWSWECVSIEPESKPV